MDTFLIIVLILFGVGMLHYFSLTNKIYNPKAKIKTKFFNQTRYFNKDLYLPGVKVELSLGKDWGNKYKLTLELFFEQDSRWVPADKKIEEFILKENGKRSILIPFDSYLVSGTIFADYFDSHLKLSKLIKKARW